MLSAYLTKCEQSIDLDESMEIAKCNVDWYKYHICRISDEMAPKLHGFAEAVDPSDQEHSQRETVVF